MIIRSKSELELLAHCMYDVKLLVDDIPEGSLPPLHDRDQHVPLPLVSLHPDHGLLCDLTQSRHQPRLSQQPLIDCPEHYKYTRIEASSRVLLSSLSKMPNHLNFIASKTVSQLLCKLDKSVVFLSLPFNIVKP